MRIREIGVLGWNAYRYGFNGQEKDDEISGVGNSMTAEFWQYDTRLGRRWNLDPKPNPSISSYAAFANNPIMFNDPLGDTITDPNGNLQNEGDGYTQSADGLTLSGDGLQTKVWDPSADVGTGELGGYVDFNEEQQAAVKIEDPLKEQGLNLPNFDINKAVETLNNNAYPHYVKGKCGYCARAVRIAIAAGGINTDKRPGSAKDYEPYMDNWGFQRISQTNYTPVLGDVRVIQSYPGGSRHGHINMYNGTKWVSDFVENGFWPGPGYRKHEPSFTIFRWPINSAVQ